MLNLALQAGIALTRALLHLAFLVGRLAGAIIAALILWLWRRFTDRQTTQPRRTEPLAPDTRISTSPIAPEAPATEITARPSFRPRPAFRPRPGSRR